MRSDSELLREFAQGGNEQAFAELVRRHVDLVYSAALRQVGHDAHLAHDVAQIVFVALARKASSVLDRPSLAGWLFKSTHYAAANTVRAERLRRTHEQESHTMHEARFESSIAIDWDHLRPVLDTAMLELSETDREIVVQRFLSGRSFADIGVAMRVTEDTARKRAARALDKLHALLGRRGIRSTSSALALVLSSHAVSAAPVGLAATLSTAVFSGATIPAAAVVVAPILAMSKLTIALTAGAVALAGLGVIHQQRQVSLARTGLATQREEYARLNAETADLRRRKMHSTAKAPLSLAENRGTAAAIPPSEITAKFGSPAQIRAGLDGIYAPLFRRLKLSEARTEKLRELLAQRRQAGFHVYDLLAAENMTMADLTPDERRQLERVAMRPFEEQIRTFLSPSDFVYYESFERTLQLRSMFTSLGVLLRSTTDPLRDEQIDALVGWAEAEYPSANPFEEHGQLVIWKHVIRGAGTLLSPLQFEKLAQCAKRMDSWRQIIEINRSAEAQGLIKASSHSRAP